MFKIHSKIKHTILRFSNRVKIQYTNEKMVFAKLVAAMYVMHPLDMNVFASKQDLTYVPFYYPHIGYLLFKYQHIPLKQHTQEKTFKKIITLGMFLSFHNSIESKK